jgi:hypothetical protein
MMLFRLSGRTAVVLPVNEIDVYRILETTIKYQKVIAKKSNHKKKYQNHKKKPGKTAQ